MPSIIEIVMMIAIVVAAVTSWMNYRILKAASTPAPTTTPAA